MMDGDRGGADMRIDLSIRAASGTRSNLGRGKRCERRLSTDLAQHAEAGAQRHPVIISAKEILEDAGGRLRVARGERNADAAFGPEQRSEANKPIFVGCLEGERDMGMRSKARR